MHTMKAAVAHDYDDVRVEELEIPRPGPHEARVKIRCCGICTGDVTPWYVRKKCPTVLGHEPAGDIVEVGSEVRGFRPGDRVFIHHHAPCLECRPCRRRNYSMCATWRASGLNPGGLAEYLVVPRVNLEHDTLVLPPELTYEDGALIEPVACVVRAFRRARVRQGDRVAIIGLGFIGQVMIRLARHYGAELVVGSDLVAYRLDKALQMGADRVVNAGVEDLAEVVRGLTGGDGADLVMCGPSKPPVMRYAIDCAGRGGTVLYFMGPEPEVTVEIAPHQVFFNEIDLICSYSCGPDDTREALELLRSGVVRSDSLITHRFPLEKTLEACRTTARAQDSLKVLVEVSARPTAGADPPESSETRPFGTRTG